MNIRTDSRARIKRVREQKNMGITRLPIRQGEQKKAIDIVLLFFCSLALLLYGIKHRIFERLP